jgi:hypothetical protein
MKQHFHPIRFGAMAEEQMEAHRAFNWDNGFRGMIVFDSPTHFPAALLPVNNIVKRA